MRITSIVALVVVFVVTVLLPVTVISKVIADNYAEKKRLEQIALQQKQQHEAKEIKCLADNIYHEARGQSKLGQMAVAFVTLNRVNNDNWGTSVCEVVYERDHRICQFTWVCEPHSYRPRRYFTEEYKEIVNVASTVYRQYNHLSDPTGGATFYHATYVDGYWFSKNLVKVAKIDDHIFYRMKD